MFASWTTRHISRGTRVLLRVDLNIPPDAHEHDARLLGACDEIRRLCAVGARVAILTHVGEPRGKRDTRFTTQFLAPLLTRVLRRRVVFFPHATGKGVVERMGSLPDGSCVLLENVRFHPGEEHNDLAFARELAQGFDVCVNNAFGVCHRQHASICAIAQFLPIFAGSLILQEVRALSRPQYPPLLLALGGVKLSTKLPLLTYLGPHVDHIVLGGGIALTFLVALQVPLPAPVDAAFRRDADVLAARAFYEKYQHKISLPIDLVIESSSRTIVDIGAQTQDLFRARATSARTVIWNGCFGITERKSGRAGTVAFADALSQLRRTRVLIGGGDTAAFVGDRVHKHTFVSTGGGAMLALLAGGVMPGLEVLPKA